MTSPGSQTRIRWCGDSNDVIREWPDRVRFNLGGDLGRLENRLEPLDFGSMGRVLPGVYELRERDATHWYRLLYVHLQDLVYVLHCFTKTTNQTLAKRHQHSSKSFENSERTDFWPKARGET
ncbi:MAG: type II toxin-antitoxin system RelE/ParE family toxin [Candidatus Acidiferrales bacterium]